MGLGAYPATGKNWLGMLGMHGTYEANMAMHDCDVMLCIGARFDDRITGRVDAFSPGSKKIHIDIDPSSINKNIRVDVPIIGDAGNVLGDLLQVFKAEAKKPDIKAWWQEIAKWRARNSLAYKKNNDIILPQYAIERLFEATRGRDTYITTEVGQHQMWAAQFFGFEEPHRWMTSGGLGTMGYGLPAALGVQVAHPDSLVIDIAGDASVQMTMQEMSTAVQYELPIKIFILNNQYMGMVRQWQQLLHGNRLSHSYSEALPDFVKLADAFGCVGLQAIKPGDLDGAIKEMISGQAPGAVRLPRRGAGKLLPDDSVRQGAQRNAAAGGSHRRSHRRGLRRRQGAGVREASAMFDLATRTRARIVGAGGAADAGACLAAAVASGSARRRRQAREPHADRRLQGARRAGLSRPAEARAAEHARIDFGHARQSRPEPRLRRRPPRRAGDDLCAARQFGREEPRHARVRRRTGRAWRGFSGRRAKKPSAAPSSTALHMVPSFHPDLVLGVATYALELLRAAPDLDVLYVPIGQGSGICGCIMARDLLGLKTEIVGVQSTEAPSYALSFAAGTVVTTETSNTLADGMATRVPDAEALAIIRKGASRIVQVTDDEVAAAMRAYWTDTHNLAEGAGAAALAAALQEKAKLAGKRVGLILSGGNIDFDLFREMDRGGHHRYRPAGDGVTRGHLRGRQ